MALVDHFKIFGKHIQLDTIAAATVTQYKAHMMATVRQGVSGVAGEYDDFSKSLAPLQGQLDGFIETSKGLAAVAKAAIDSYLTVVLAPLFALPANSTPTQVVAELANQMVTASATLDAQGAHTPGFHDYFQTNYSVDLPHVGGGNGTINDSLITSTLT